MKDAEVLSAISELEKTYSLVEGTDFFAPYEDCLQERADSVLSVVYTVEHLQPPVKQLQHGKFWYVNYLETRQLTKVKFRGMFCSEQTSCFAW